MPSLTVLLINKNEIEYIRIVLRNAYMQLRSTKDCLVFSCFKLVKTIKVHLPSRPYQTWRYYFSRKTNFETSKWIRFTI